MSVYFKFEESDLLWALVNASPQVVLASGTHGWHGNVGASSSLSLYEGVRARSDVKAGSNSGIQIYPMDPMDTHSIDRVVYVSGSYPATGSVHFVKCRQQYIDETSLGQFFTLVTSDDWYGEHFSPILNLFDYYSRYNSEYFTGSYDYYSLYLHQPIDYRAPSVIFASNFISVTTSSGSFMAQIKPTATGGLNRDFTIHNQAARYKFYITGSTGQLAFSDYKSVVTSSATVSLGEWQNVAVTVDGNSASFYFNGQLDSRVAFTGSLPLVFNGLRVGAESYASGSSKTTVIHNGFNGFIFESRVWNRTLPAAEISGNWNSRLTITPSATDPVHYAKFNDGPLGTAHGFAQGSGVFDYGTLGLFGAHGQFSDVNTVLPLFPTWQPNDNPNFVMTKNRINDQITQFRVLHVPSMFYGRQVATGSVRLECHAYSNQGIVRTLVDDGKGRLYVSGSMARPISGEEYTGARWNKVGNVFYNEGLVVITDPSMQDFGDVNLDSNIPDTLQVTFNGLERISSAVFQCRVGEGQANASNNPTFSRLDTDTSSQFFGKSVIKKSPPTTWISAVGLYNEQRQLVAVAKLASPIRKREKDKLLIRLRLDI